MWADVQVAEGEALPLVLVGAGKSLALRNVRLVHAASLGACLQLGAGGDPLLAVPACVHMSTCAVARAGRRLPMAALAHTCSQEWHVRARRRGVQPVLHAGPKQLPPCRFVPER